MLYGVAALSFMCAHWEIIADNLSKAGWSWGCVSALDSYGRIISIADAPRGDGKRFVVRADEKLTAFGTRIEAGVSPAANHLVCKMLTSSRPLPLDARDPKT
jgi:hypothetical protein